MKHHGWTRKLRPARAVRVLAVGILAAGAAAACGTAPYEGTAEQVVAPTFPPPTTTAPTTTAPTTTAPPSTSVPATTAVPTTAAPTTVPATTATGTAPGRVEVPGTGVTLVVPTGWRVGASSTSGGAALERARRSIGALAPAAVVDGARLVLVRDDAADGATPTVVVALSARNGASNAAAAVAQEREQRASTLAASAVGSEPRVLAGGAYVTYRGTVNLDGRATTVVSEHDAFDVGDRVLWVIFTTTDAGADADATAFGRVLLSLRTA